MNKREFISKLRAELCGLPKQDLEERVDFYAEMIDDRMEDGLSEEEAVSMIGPVETVVEQIVSDVPLAKLAKEKIRSKRRLRAWEIVLLALGSPIWLSLAVAVLVVIFALYIVLWAVIISLWAVFVSLVACAVGGVAAGIIIAVNGNTLSGIAMLGAGLVCAGLAIFLFFGCKAATKGTLLLTERMTLGIKKLFVGRGKHDE